MISGTITDASGRTLVGQTPEAFWNSVRHARPFSVGLNCALGARALRPYLQELARVADVPVSIYPNAGPAERVRRLRRDGPRRPRGAPGVRRRRPGQHRRRLLRDDARPCPGDRRGGPRPRRRGSSRPSPRLTRLSGLEPLAIPQPGNVFVNVGERTNVTGSRAFAKVDPRRAVRRRARDRAQQVENGAQIIDINMDEGMLDSEAAMTPLPRPDRRRAGHRPGPGDDRLLEVVGHRGRA